MSHLRKFSFITGPKNLPEGEKTQRTIFIHLPGYSLINFTSNTLTTPSALHEKSPSSLFPSKHFQKNGSYIYKHRFSICSTWGKKKIFTGIF